GNAPINTAVMEETKIANRCQAGAVSPAGTGENVIASANAKGASRLISKDGLSIPAGPPVAVWRVITARRGAAELVMIWALQIPSWHAPALRVCVPSARRTRLAWFHPQTQVQSATRIHSCHLLPHSDRFRR